MPSRAICGVALLIAALGTGGCGSERPNESELTEALLDNGSGSLQGELWIGRVNAGVERDQAECIAEVLLASEIESEALRALVDEDPAFEPDQQMLKDLIPIYEQLGACMGVTGDPDQLLEN